MTGKSFCLLDFLFKCRFDHDFIKKREREREILIQNTISSFHTFDKIIKYDRPNWLRTHIRIDSILTLKMFTFIFISYWSLIQKRKKIFFKYLKVSACVNNIQFVPSLAAMLWHYLFIEEPKSKLKRPKSNFFYLFIAKKKLKTETYPNQIHEYI